MIPMVSNSLRCWQDMTLLPVWHCYSLWLIHSCFYENRWSWRQADFTWGTTKVLPRHSSRQAERASVSDTAVRCRGHGRFKYWQPQDWSWNAWVDPSCFAAASDTTCCTGTANHAGGVYFVLAFRVRVNMRKSGNITFHLIHQPTNWQRSHFRMLLRVSQNLWLQICPKHYVSIDILRLLCVHVKRNVPMTFWTRIFAAGKPPSRISIPSFSSWDHNLEFQGLKWVNRAIN